MTQSVQNQVLFFFGSVLRLVHEFKWYHSKQASHPTTSWSSSSSNLILHPLQLNNFPALLCLIILFALLYASSSKRVYLSVAMLLQCSDAATVYRVCYSVAASLHSAATQPLRFFIATQCSDAATSFFVSVSKH